MSLTRGMPVGTRRKKSGAGSVVVDHDILEDDGLEDGEYVSPPPLDQPNPREGDVNPAVLAASGGGAVLTARNDEMRNADATGGERRRGTRGGNQQRNRGTTPSSTPGGYSPANNEMIRDEDSHNGAAAVEVLADEDGANDDKEWIEMTERYDATKASRRPGSAAAKHKTRRLERADPKPPAKAPVEKAINRKAVTIAVSAGIVVIAIILVIVFVMSSNDDDDGDEGDNGNNGGGGTGGNGLGNVSYAQPSEYLPGVQLYPSASPGTQSIVAYSEQILNNNSSSSFGQPSSYSRSGWEMSCPWVEEASSNGGSGADTVVDSGYFSDGISSRQHQVGQTFPSPTRSWLQHYVELLLSYGPRLPARNTDSPETAINSGWGKSFQMLSSMLRCKDLPFGSSAGGLWQNHANKITGKGLKWKGFWDVWYNGPFEEIVYRAGTIPEFTSRFTNLVAELNPTLVSTADGTTLSSAVNQETKGHILLAAHFDTKWFASNPDPPFVGASDSAVPCVMILELMRRLSTKVAAETLKKHEMMSTTTTTSNSSNFQEMPKVTVVFFDGEESFYQWLYNDHTYGSRHMARAWNQVDPTFTNITKFILLDLIAPSAPSFRNFFSATTPDYLKMKSIEAERRTNGVRLGEYSHTYFPGTTALSTNSIDDDHRPFQDRGLDRILHLIASPFPSTWHTTRDSAASVNYDTVEELVEIFWSYLDQF